MREQDLGKILIYKNEKGDTKIDVYFEGDTIWLSQKSLAKLYQVRIPTINEHIKNILSDGELDESTIREFLIVQNEGGRQSPKRSSQTLFCPCAKQNALQRPRPYSG